ncbi:MAG: ABC transporter permease [Vicinamibacterales bacterium]
MTPDPDLGPAPRRADDAPARLPLRLARAAVHLVAPIVPADRRAGWRRQWEADLHYQWAFLTGDAAGHRVSPARALDLLSRAGGVVPHALALRYRSWTMPTLMSDLRYGARTLVSRPGFAAVAVLLLGLGIGANATVFAWVQNFLLRPLPGATHVSDVVVLHGTTKTRRDISMSYPNFADLAARRPDGVLDLAAERFTAVNVRTSGDPERAWAEIVTGEFFELMGVQPAEGRVLSPDDDRTPGGHPVTVLSYRYWQRRFQADPAVIGSTLSINGHPYTVVGVSAPDFRGGMPAMSTDVFVPMMMQASLTPGNRLVERGNAWLTVYARLAPGTGIPTAQAGLSAVAAQLAAEFPDVNTDRGIAVYPLSGDPQSATGIFGPVFMVLGAVVGIVLLIVCANLASLLIVRGASRQREIAVRLALGASRARIIRQLLAENVLLAIAGAAAGVVFAVWASRLFRGFVPPSPLPIDATVQLSSWLPLFSLGLALAATIVFGLLPALQASRPGLVPALRESRGTTGGRRRTRLRNLLVASQVALSALLLVGAALFARTLANAERFDVGFDLDRGLLASVDLLPAGYDQPRGLDLLARLIAEVERIPGVESAAIARDLPLKLGGGSDTSGRIEGYEPARGEEITLFYDRVSPGFFRTLGVPLRDGRVFTARDDGTGEHAVVINETMAKRYWPDGKAVGGRVWLGEWATVIGVVGDLTYTTPGAAPVAFMYLPLAEYYRPDVTLIVRTKGDPDGIVRPVRQALAGLDPDVPLFDVRTMAQHRDMVLFIPRIVATLLGALGAAAMVLAAVGLYGLLAFSVSQRTPEIGIRLALGAQRGQVYRLVVGQGLWLAASGVAIGLGLAALLLPLASSQLIGVGPRDVVAYAAAAFVLLGGAFLASYLPARRAARVDPIRALRYE